LTAQSQVLSLSRSLLTGDAATALAELDSLAKNGKDLGRLVSDLLNHFRNLLIFQITSGNLKMIEVGEAEAVALKAESAGVPPDAMTRMMETLSDCEMRLRDAASKKILVEVALLKTIEARQAVSLDSVLQQLQNLRGNGTASAPETVSRSPAAPTPAPVQRSKIPEQRSVPAAQTAPAVIRETAPPTPVTGGDIHLSDLWNQLVESVGRASPFVRSYLLEAHAVSFAKNVFIIGFDGEFEHHIGLVDNARNHTLLQTKLAELGHAGAQIKFIKSERPADWAAPSTTEASPTPAPTPVASGQPPAAAIPAPASKEKNKPFNKDDFKNDPLIQKALEVFKGQIVEIRA